MIFFNSEPIYPCGKCQREVPFDDQAILCEVGCNFWYHLNCTKLSLFTYEQLCNIPNSIFVCDSCIKTIQKNYYKFDKHSSPYFSPLLQFEHQKLREEHEKFVKSEQQQQEVQMLVHIENSLDKVEYEYQNRKPFVQDSNGLKTNNQILQCMVDKAQDENKLIESEITKLRENHAEIFEELTKVKKTQIDFELKTIRDQSELSAKNQHLEVENSNLKKVVKEKVLENENMKAETETAKNENIWLLSKSAEISQQNSQLEMKLAEQELQFQNTESELRAKIDLMKNDAEEKQNDLKTSLEESSAGAQFWYHRSDELASENLDLEEKLRETEVLLDEKTNQLFVLQSDLNLDRAPGLTVLKKLREKFDAIHNIGGHLKNSLNLNFETEKSKESLNENLEKSDDSDSHCLEKLLKFANCSDSDKNLAKSDDSNCLEKLLKFPNCSDSDENSVSDLTPETEEPLKEIMEKSDSNDIETKELEIDLDENNSSTPNFMDTFDISVILLFFSFYFYLLFL